MSRGIFVHISLVFSFKVSLYLKLYTFSKVTIKLANQLTSYIVWQYSEYSRLTRENLKQRNKFSSDQSL